MKDNWNRRWIPTTLTLAVVIVLAGCGKSNPTSASTPNNGPAGVEISKVEKAFTSADASFRFPLDEALRIVKAGGYADALPQLQKLAANPRLTSDQKQSLQDLVQKLQTMPPQGGDR
jgi:hypothetical protein